MPEFKMIETQEELDKIIQNRLEREKEKHLASEQAYEELKVSFENLSKENAALQEEVQKSSQRTAAFETQVEELKSKVTGYEQARMKTAIALEYQIPYDLADRLQGCDEESLRKDAEKMASLFVTKTSAPLKTTEPTIQEDTLGLRQMVRNLSKGE